MDAAIRNFNGQVKNLCTKYQPKTPPEAVVDLEKQLNDLKKELSEKLSDVQKLQQSLSGSRLAGATEFARAKDLVDQANVLMEKDLDGFCPTTYDFGRDLL